MSSECVSIELTALLKAVTRMTAGHAQQLRISWSRRSGHIHRTHACFKILSQEKILFVVHVMSNPFRCYLVLSLVLHTGV